MLLLDGGIGHLLKERGVQVGCTCRISYGCAGGRLRRRRPEDGPACSVGCTLLLAGRDPLCPTLVQDLVPGLKYDEMFLAGALANELAPEAVLGVHREYIHAGEGRLNHWFI